jgi:hypothetical protein
MCTNLNERQLLRNGRGHEDLGDSQDGEHVSGRLDPYLRQAVAALKWPRGR